MGLFAKKTSSYLELPYAADLSDKLTVVDRTGKYLGHPDLVETDEGKMLIVYPSGHGRGAIIMKTSGDFGKTWSERRCDLPESWKKSQETPTIYNLHFTNGKTRLILVSGCPHWNAGVRDGVFLPEMFANGFNFSYSDDGGKSWSEFENFYSPMNCVVCMSSLTQLKENGVFVDKWMGTFHEPDFTNYKSILTFDETGAHWSKPEPLLAPHREIEKKVGICEIEIIRAPSDVLILLARGETRKTSSVISLSYDEGKTWTAPKELPYVLCGDRHKAVYDERSGKVIVSFRQLIIPKKRSIFSRKRRLSDGWAAWVGTFDDLISMATNDDNSRYGEKLYLVARNYGQWYDCGYNGIVIRDGKALIVSYGTFDKTAKNPFIAAALVAL